MNGWEIGNRIRCCSSDFGDRNFNPGLKMFPNFPATEINGIDKMISLLNLTSWDLRDLCCAVAHKGYFIFVCVGGSANS